MAAATGTVPPAEARDTAAPTEHGTARVPLPRTSMGRGREGPIQAHGYILGQEVEGLLAPSGTGTRGPPALSVMQRVNQPHVLWGRSRTAQNTAPARRAVAPPATAGKPKTRVRGSRGCLQVTPQQGQDGDLIRTPSPLPAPRRLSCRTGPRTPQSPPGPGVPRPQGHPHQELTGGGHHTKQKAPPKCGR